MVRSRRMVPSGCCHIRVASGCCHIRAASGCSTEGSDHAGSGGSGGGGSGGEAVPGHHPPGGLAGRVVAADKEASDSGEAALTTALVEALLVRREAP